MNFVDVQPKSFLDYAWTSPSSSVVTAPKPSKTSRKQNRCCDQCRKGKRACDAAILEDTLLETSKTGASPTVFHYSDVYGPLASCSNCEKTKKTCTFDWLRSQRVLQASQPQAASTPSPKRRRTRSNSTSKPQKVDESFTSSVTAERTEKEPAHYDEAIFNITPPVLGVTFGDFACGSSMFPIDPTTSFFDGPVLKTEGENSEILLDPLEAVSEEGSNLLGCHSSKASSLRMSSDTSDKPDDSPTTEYEASVVTETDSMNTKESIVRSNRKRRRRSSSTASHGAPPYPAISYGSSLLSSSNNTYLSENLLRIYHDSFENALACWVTEKTCPYSARSNDLLSTNARPDWKSIYHRVIRLDRLAMAIRGRRLTQTEDRAASKALDLAVLSFASQWAQSGQRSRTRYPFHSTGTKGDSGVFDGQEDDHRPTDLEFDRTLQMTAWHNARNALQKASEIESFRVVLAQMIFALTQKPTETNMPTIKGPNNSITPEVMSSTNSSEYIPNSPTASIDADMDECTDLMSKLDLAIEADGPPLHLESGLRLIHSLRSRMAVSRKQRHSKPEPVHCGQRQRVPAMRLEEADRATVDLLFWLGVTFDTLSSAMHKRPLVVSDEDSNAVLNESMQTNSPAFAETQSASESMNNNLWDGCLFTGPQDARQVPTRWPCSFDQAATALCDAAPVKVLLFRRVCRIQTLLTRNARGMRVEEAVHAALDVCNHWDALYAPFARDCIQHHSSLPPRIQSWYICVTGHWHLATLLLADLLEVVDESELGLEDATEHRKSIGFIARFRENNCRVLSDLASCACPNNDTPLLQSPELNFTTQDGALLTDPWTAVLIRAFAKAGVLLLESETLLPSEMDQEDAFRRADDCIKALWFLGKKSDMALAAARILGDALRQRRKSAQDRISDMTAFLASQPWDDLDGLNGVFDADCEL